MNISPRTVSALQRWGWDVVRVSDSLPATATDLQILGYAREHGRVVVTQDLDFSTLLALSGHGQPSLITVRLATSDPDTVSLRLGEVLRQYEREIFAGCAVTVGDASVRVRGLPLT